MTKRTCPIALCALALACGPGAPQESTTAAPDTSSSTGDDLTGSTSGAVTPSTTSTTTSGDPTTTSDTTTSGTTTPLESTSGTTTTGFETCGEGETVEPEGVPADLPFCIDPQVEWLEQHLDCALDCSDATQLHGEGPAAGLLLVSQITFSINYGVCGQGLRLQRFFLGHPLAPQASVWAWLECGLDPWLGTFPVSGRLADGTDFSAMLTIDGYAGDWNSPDPVDPPRLFGSFTGDLVGPFDATHCAANDVRQVSCGR